MFIPMSFEPVSSIPWALQSVLFFIASLHSQTTSEARLPVFRILDHHQADGDETGG
jgi:hypothetical protein